MLTNVSRKRLVVLCVLISLIVCAAILAVQVISQARRDGRRCQADCRLGQMRLALQNYEEKHGVLPPLVLRNQAGNVLHSWRALITPHLGDGDFKQLDLSQPWNSEKNRTIIESIPLRDWAWFSQDLPPSQAPATTQMFAFLGPASIWDAETGMPKGTTKELPEAILLILVPDSTVDPMEPRDITETEVRKLVEEGQEVYFIMASKQHGYGTVTMEDGALTWRTWQDVLDQREAAK